MHWTQDSAILWEKASNMQDRAVRWVRRWLARRVRNLVQATLCNAL